MSFSLAGEYSGPYENGRFQGAGSYKFSGNTYEGNFDNGEFSGEGKLTMKGGGLFQGYWKNGELVEGGYVFSDGLQHTPIGTNSWEYCTSKDPRFYSEMVDGIKNGDTLSKITQHEYGNDLPKGCYDVIDGYYEPKAKCVYRYDNNELLREVEDDEVEWIKANCRIGKE